MNKENICKKQNVNVTVLCCDSFGSLIKSVELHGSEEQAGARVKDRAGGRSVLNV